MKPQHDYTRMDTEILLSLKEGKKTITYLQCGQVMREAENLANEDKNKRRTVSYRFLERRLQALRKAGKITYSTKSGWSLVENGGEA